MPSHFPRFSTGLAVAALMLALPSTLLADDAAEKKYANLLEDAKRNPDKADFKALRLAFTETKAYQPYGVPDKEEKAVKAALGKGGLKAALEEVDRQLQKNYINIKMHMLAMSILEKLGEEGDRAELHKKFLKGLIEAIVKPGDGKSFETAYPVIEVREEYIILQALELSDGKQRLMSKDGHEFDVFVFEDEKTGAERQVYFNIDVPKAWLHRTLLKEDSKK